MRCCWMLSFCGVLSSSVVAGESPDAYPASPIPFLGDYVGEWRGPDGVIDTIHAQVYPIGDDRYRARITAALGDLEEPLVALEGVSKKGGVFFGPGLGRGSNAVIRPIDGGVVVAADLWEGVLSDGSYTGTSRGMNWGSFRLEESGLGRYSSPTLAEAPPASATVLFRGDSLSAWRGDDGEDPQWRLVEGGAMEIVPDTSTIHSQESFGDHRLHLEFRSPYEPADLGQKRGNSGVYLHGRYEVQILDSYGLKGEWNECGGIYQVARPRVNMCAPPTVWQTYDIEFRAPRFNDQGEKVENARITVRHNGVMIHEDQELPSYTGGPLSPDEVEAGPLRLQNHGDRVQFRNIWVMPLEN